MKQVLLFCASLLLMQWTSAQADTSFRPVEFSDSTAHGRPDGNPVSKEITPSGGTLTSEDGRIELIFPEGALTKNTTITIQPVTNHAPNGSGKSYWFEPSGIQFKKPVTIIFHYTDEEAEECPPDWMSLASQDHEGKWSFIEYDEWDSTGKSLKGSIHHFSGVSNIYQLKLVPVREEVGVNQFNFIQLLDIRRLRGNWMEQRAVFDPNTPIMWYVNDKLNEHPSYGKIESRPYRGDLSNNNRRYITRYYAPSLIPPQAVKVRAEIYMQATKKNSRAFVPLSCRFEIYDRFEFHFSVVLDNTALGMGTIRAVDTASCEIMVKNIRSGGGSQRARHLFFTQKVRNIVCVIEKYSCPPNCSCEITNRNTCIGPLNLVALEDIEMPAEQGGSKTATARFTSTPGNSPSARLSCHGHAARTIPSMPFMTFPLAPIKFECVDEEQVQEYTYRDLKYILRIKRIKDMYDPSTY